MFVPPWKLSVAALLQEKQRCNTRAALEHCTLRVVRNTN
jgi:hypothetical protein